MRPTIPLLCLSGLLGCDSLKARAEQEQSASVSCLPDGDAVNCEVTRKKGDRGLEVCWDVVFACSKPKKKRKAHACTTFAATAPANDPVAEPKAPKPGTPGARVKKRLEPTDFQSNCDDDTIEGYLPPLAIENVTFAMK